MYTTDLAYPMIFDKLVVYLNYKTTVVAISEIRPFLFDESGGFRQYYGSDGLKHFTTLLEDWKVRKQFEDEINQLIRLTGSVKNYIANYIYCMELEPDRNYTDVSSSILDDLNMVSPDFKHKVIDLFEPEIQQIISNNKLVKENTTQLDFDENSWVGSLEIEAMQNIYREQTGQEISREEVIKMMQKLK